MSTFWVHSNIYCVYYYIATVWMDPQISRINLGLAIAVEWMNEWFLNGTFGSRRPHQCQKMQLRYRRHCRLCEFSNKSASFDSCVINHSNSICSSNQMPLLSVSNWFLINHMTFSLCLFILINYEPCIDCFEFWQVSGLLATSQQF